MKLQENGKPLAITHVEYFQKCFPNADLTKSC